MGYASQLKLFRVGDRMPAYFQNKRMAKKSRDGLNAVLAKSEPRFVVMRGPDHWRGESFNKSHQMRGKRSRV